LVGGILKGHENYLEELKKMANGKIFFHNNLSFKELVKLYGESSIYWHAAGFGETDPEKMEHFGMTTVEAMASGCIPVVINLGGQPEIVDQNENGFLWDNPSEMINQTVKLIKDQNLLKSYSQKAIEKSKMFSKNKFFQNIEGIINGNF
jgi:glycosyltransferase involved in cell wall biosynthesis